MLAFLIPPEPRSISSIPGRHRGENHVFFLWPAPSHKAEALPPGPVCQEYWDPDCPYLSSLIGRRHHIKNSPEDQGLPICPPTCLLTEWECSNNRGPHPYLQYSDTLRQAMELFPHGLLYFRHHIQIQVTSSRKCACMCVILCVCVCVCAFSSSISGKSDGLTFSYKINELQV